MTSEAPKEMTTTHLAPDEIDKLRFKAFATNKKDDVLAYYKAASLYFQERHERAINRQSHALAMVAAAYEDATELVAHDHVCDAIRARTPDDAQAALDALLRAERVKALKEAAEIVRGLAPTIEHDSTQDDRMHESILERAARHIEGAAE